MAIIKAFRSQDGEIRFAEDGSELYEDLLAEGGQVNVPALEQVISEDGETNTSLIQKPSYSHVAGRFYIYGNRTWVTDSDDNYGTAYFQFFESGGTGSEPVYEWEHHGTFYKAGTTIKEFIFSGRASNSDVGDFEMRLVAKYPDDPTDWDTGFNTDSAVSIQTIFSGLYSEMGVEATQLNRMTRGKVDLDVTLEQDSLVSIYIRRVGTSSSTRYFNGSRILGVI